MNWYVVQAFSGQELHVQKRILALAESAEMRDRIGQVLVPMQETITVSGGKKRSQLRKLVPGYVYVELEMDEVVNTAIASVPGVMGFLGNANRPEPLSQAEVDRLLGVENSEAGGEGGVIEIPFSAGDAVRIKSGPFMNFDGTVEEVQPEKGKLKVMVSVFGRFTPVELGFDQVDGLS